MSEAGDAVTLPPSPGWSVPPVGATTPIAPTIADHTPPLGVAPPRPAQTVRAITVSAMPPEGAPVALAFTTRAGWAFVAGCALWLALLLAAAFANSTRLAPLYLPAARLLLALLGAVGVGGLLAPGRTPSERIVPVGFSIFLAPLAVPTWPNGLAQSLALVVALSLAGLSLAYQLLPAPSRQHLGRFADEVACALHFHSWTAWSEVGPGCQVTRRCRSCGVPATRAAHAWGERRYLHEGSCEQARVCERCGKHDAGATKVHRWGQPEHAAAHDCTLVRRCQGCGETKPAGAIRHDWEPWQLVSPASCRQERRCRRCRKIESGDLAHDWGQVAYRGGDSCQRVRLCQRCRHEEEVGAAVHKWGKWEYESPVECQLVRYCLRCHEPDRGTVEHRWGAWADDRERGRSKRVCDHCGAVDATRLRR